jgi:hypothetical protein
VVWCCGSAGVGGDKINLMAIQSTSLGSTRITGDDAKRFNRLVTHGRGSLAAQQAVQNGRTLAEAFVKYGEVGIHLKNPVQASHFSQAI